MVSTYHSHNPRETNADRGTEVITISIYNFFLSNSVLTLLATEEEMMSNDYDVHF